jgi:hypothetical protein
MNVIVKLNSMLLAFLQCADLWLISLARVSHDHGPNIQ